MALQKSFDTGSFAFLPTKLASAKEADLRDMFKKASNGVRSIAWPLMTANQQIEKISKWKTTLVSCTTQALRT